MAAEAAAMKKSKILGFVLAKISLVSNRTGINQVTNILEITTNRILKIIFLNAFKLIVLLAVISPNESA